MRASRLGLSKQSPARTQLDALHPGVWPTGLPSLSPPSPQSRLAPLGSDQRGPLRQRRLSDLQTSNAAASGSNPLNVGIQGDDQAGLIVTTLAQIQQKEEGKLLSHPPTGLLPFKLVKQRCLRACQISMV